MTRTGFLRKAALLLLAAVLLFPWAASAGPQAGSPRGTHVSTFTFLDLLSRAWGFLTSGEKEGCHIDPHGGCAPGVTAEPAPAIQTDTGCHIDPHGGCRS